MSIAKSKDSPFLGSYYFYSVLLACFIALIFIGDKAHAAPAAPIKQQYAQPNGITFYAQQHGDETFNWKTASNGAVIAKNADGYWSYAVMQGNQLIAGPAKVAIQPPPAHFLTSKDVLELYQQHSQLKNASSAPTSQALRSPVYSSGEISTDLDMSSPHPLLVVLVEFNDIAMTTAESDWNSLVFGSTGKTVNAFYKEASNNQFYFTPANETGGTANDGVIKVSLPQAHPDTADDASLAALEINQQIAAAAVTAANSQVNFADYDTDHDGYVSRDELHVMTILAGQETSFGEVGVTPSVWGHFSALEDADSPSVDGVKLLAGDKNGGYTQFGEYHGDHQATIGIIVHELGHDLDLPDLYDVNTVDNEDTGGVGGFSVMGAGSWAHVLSDNDEPGETPVHFDAWSKVFLGFETPIEIPYGTDISVTLNAIATSNPDSYNVYKVLTQNPDQYFLLENRQQNANSGFDRGLKLFTDKSGIAIWHIDSYYIENYYWNVNDERPLGVDLESFYDAPLDPFYHDGYRFDLYSNPGSIYNNGDPTGISIYTNSPASSAMSVNVGVSPSINATPTTNATATSVSYTLQWNEAVSVHYVVLPSEDAEPTIGQVLQGEDGNGNPASLSGQISAAANAPSTFTLNNLTVSTSYTIYLVSEDSSGHRYAAIDYFSTGSPISVGSPVINEAAANDGSITATQTVTVTNATYGGSVTDATYGTFDPSIASGDITIHNLPAGLGYTVTRTDPTTLTITFTGKATNHANANDVSNVSIKVAANKIIGISVPATTNTFAINFNDPTPITGGGGGGGFIGGGGGGGGGAPSPEVSDKGDQGVCP
ncbi:M6 family metalloprotease domain-containing protein [Cohnella cholangitidis]|uniref:M6 family metalloprotease domain-containing protein n=1 Tax=Cohnella cholangitidis TaxID=2598458 RepID=UPI0015FC2159|nr:M6 family metalloprotease domain-containing protein [Cohnella cholangitidis]